MSRGLVWLDSGLLHHLRDPRDARRIYLGTADGVLYRSDDAGVHWRRMQPGFPRRGMSLDDIVVDAKGAIHLRYTENNLEGHRRLGRCDARLPSWHRGAITCS